MATAKVQPPMATCVDVGPSGLVRAANFVVAYTRVEAGTVLERRGHADEHLAFLYDAGADVSAGAEGLQADAGTLVILPPGDSRIVARGTGQIARVFTARNQDLAEAAVNATTYAERPPAVAALGSAPVPVGGHRLMAHRLADHPVDQGGFRVFRSGSLMINLFGARTARRDPTALTPHWHDDLEQASLVLEGAWIHHLRYPWVPDMSSWRPDEHIRCGAPSVTIIPAGVEHTSQDLGEGTSLLVDVFGPPRQDFIERGLVLNQADYV